MSAAHQEAYQFAVLDYAIFFGMLVVSACTGFYFGCRNRYCGKKADADLREYLLGSKELHPFPVAMSLIGSYISGVTMLGTPAEVYHFGTQYWFIAISIWFSGGIVAYFTLPVLFKLGVNSSYEYLEIRFGREARILASVLFVLDEVMFLPIVIYVPSLAFNQVSGVNVHLIGTIVCVVCVVYTVLGGLRAVVYTDAWQIAVMFLSVVLIAILGTIHADGFDAVWKRNAEGGRLIFTNFNPSLYERQTIWGVLIGGITYWTAFNGVNQTMVQRYLSLPTLRKSRISILIFNIGVSGFVSLCVYCGLLIYATYWKCDPMSAERINHMDQLFPLFVMESAGKYHGIPGLFIAGVFGAALSSLSVILNSTGMVVLEDFIQGCLRLKLNDRQGQILVKSVILILGSISVAFLFIVEHLGGMLAAASSLSAIAGGTTFGMFVLGMVNPWCNTVGVLVGAIAGAFMSSLIAFGGRYSAAVGLVMNHVLPLNVDRCWVDYGIHANITEIIYPDESGVFPLFRLSFHWITPFGVLTTFVVGSIVSLCTGRNDPKRLDPEVISPVFQWLLPAESQQYAGTAARKHRQRMQDDNRGLMQETVTVSSINLRTTPDSTAETPQPSPKRSR